MGQVCLISGPPGCGKTTWALQRLQQHQGPCAYLRLEGEKAAGLEARQRAAEIGCNSVHENNGRWMPCADERELHQQLRKQ